MGKDFIDKDSVGHLIGGISYRLVVFPHSPVFSFLLSITIHAISESIELPRHPITGSLETVRNRIGDLVIFSIGWFIGGFLNDYLPQYSTPLLLNVRVWLLVIVIIATAREIIRELYINRDSKLYNLLYRKGPIY